jgi:hypothetical protein
MSRAVALAPPSPPPPSPPPLSHPPPPPSTPVVVVVVVVVVIVVVAIRASGPSTIRAISSTVPSGSEKERSTPRQNLALDAGGAAGDPLFLDGATRSLVHDDDDMIVESSLTSSSSSGDAHSSFECDDDPLLPHADA